MSYTVRSSATIHGSESTTADYPASENGGSHSVTVDWSEDIEIRVTVEDDPFQDRVEQCKRHLDALTAAVVATEAAQVASKGEAAEKIASSVINGFFGLIRSEIQQQMTELSALLPPKVQELNGFMERCRALTQQMERDYARIGERYSKLFSDLDKELLLRIQSLDREAFSLRRLATELTETSRSATNVITPMVTLKERENAQSLLLVHGMRQSALAMVESTRQLVAAGLRLGEVLQKIRDDIGIDVSATIAIPLLYIETDGIGAVRAKEGRLLYDTKSCIASVIASRQTQIISAMNEAKTKWGGIGAEDRNRVEASLNAMISKSVSSAGEPRAVREAKMIGELWHRTHHAVITGERQ